MSRKKQRAENPASSLQWWLSSGAEHCLCCHTPVHAEALAYCAACDCEVCALCVVTTPEPGVILCRECAQEAMEEKR